ncbi:MAG: DUF2569 family protein [Acidobacteriota bacterium]|nr:DUF2569 family protein [Acidobacteriota bacterium]
MTQSNFGDAHIAARQEDNLKGVKGWLLVFCIILTVISPVITIFGVVVGWRAASPLFDKVPGLDGLILLDSLLNLGIAGLAIFVGVRLWSVKPSADKTAKSFLVALPIIRAVMFMIVLFSDVRGLGFAAFMALFQASVFAMIWHAYLDRSKRVQATFAQVPKQVSISQTEAQ